jgi:hypothetical protein
VRSRCDCIILSFFLSLSCVSSSILFLSSLIDLHREGRDHDHAECTHLHSGRRQSCLWALQHQEITHWKHQSAGRLAL